MPPLLALAAWERRRYGPRGDRLRARSRSSPALLFAPTSILWHHSIARSAPGSRPCSATSRSCSCRSPPGCSWRAAARRVLAAVPIVLSGVVLISGVVGAEAYGDDPPLGVLYGLLTAFAYRALVLRAGNRDVSRRRGRCSSALAAGARRPVPGGSLGGAGRRADVAGARLAVDS